MEPIVYVALEIVAEQEPAACTVLTALARNLPFMRGVGPSAGNTTFLCAQCRRALLENLPNSLQHSTVVFCCPSCGAHNRVSQRLAQPGPLS